MDETLDRLLRHYGPGAKAVVWAHNAHVGDARARHGKNTLGELVRYRYGADEVVLVGSGTHRGTVTAGESWGAPMGEMAVPPARENSLEDILHATAPARAILVFPPEGPPTLLTDELAHRAIGVVYRPDRGNYAPTVLGERYDAFLWFDETRAVRPLHPAAPLSGDLRISVG